MGNIWITSDLHIGHDKEFIWKVRGFNSITEMNDTIISRWNNLIDKEDDIYVLGDLMLGDSNKGIEYLKRLNGKIHIVLGNHDTTNREKLYRELPNVVEIAEVGIKLKYRKYNFVLTHFPMITDNLEKESLKQMTLNLYGHTHQQNNFYYENAVMYHVGMDSHNCMPILLDDIIEEMKSKVKKCVSLLDDQACSHKEYTTSSPIEIHLEIQNLGKELVNKTVEYLRGEVSREEIMESFNKTIQNEINEFCHHNLQFSTWDDIDDEFDYSDYFDDMNDVFKLLNKNKH